jgi:hypothetical protein
VVGLADNTPTPFFPPANSVTYGGQPLTLQVLNGGANPVSEIWTLLSPPSGTAMIVVTYPTSERVIGGSVSFAGVNQTTPIREGRSARVNGISPSTLSTPVITNTGDVVIDAVALVTEFGSIAPDASQTQRWNIAVGAVSDTVGGGSTKPAAGPSTTMSWTLSSIPPTRVSPGVTAKLATRWAPFRSWFQPPEALTPAQAALVNGALAAISLIPCPAPTITCPANIQTFTDSGKSTATVNPGQPSTSGGCGPVTVKGVRSDGKALTDPYPLGVTMITWTATDGISPPASCPQTITVLTPTGGGYHPGPVGVCPKGKRRC